MWDTIVPRRSHLTQFLERIDGKLRWQISCRAREEEMTPVEWLAIVLGSIDDLANQIAEAVELIQDELRA